MQILKYYPDRNVIVMVNGWRAVFNLTTGEDDYETEFIDVFPDKKYRIVGARYGSFSDNEGDLRLYIQKKKGKGYETIIDLMQLLELPSRRDFYLVYQGSFYLLYMDAWWKVSFTQTESK